MDQADEGEAEVPEALAAGRGARRAEQGQVVTADLLRDVGRRRVAILPQPTIEGCRGQPSA
ncbi:MAG: hypothetical protein QME94_18065, partial [Anaerolineae bacterium]|nr:hypothetical protein [Anaerolineae bacterium]